MEKRLEKVTLTGADDTVSPSQLLDISRRYPFAEWGILVSRRQMGNPRFPSAEWLRDFRSACSEADQHGHAMLRSCHVCGQWVRDILGGDFSLIHEALQVFHRIQLNFHGEPHVADPEFFLKLDGLGTNPQQIIMQVDLKNDGLFRSARRITSRCVPLFDVSHGTGKLPEVGEWAAAGRWPSPDDLSAPLVEAYGYAGGLGLDNLPGQLEEILEASTSCLIWIDMETKLRDNADAFDLGKCEAVLEACKPYVRRQP